MQLGKIGYLDIYKNAVHIYLVSEAVYMISL